MGGWKKLEVKDLDLDIEGSEKLSGPSKPGSRIEDRYDPGTLPQKPSQKGGATPIQIWAEYRSYREDYSRSAGEKLPEWILEYFDKVANQLLNAKPGSDVRKLCQSALGISKKEVTGKKRSKSKQKKPKKRKRH